MPGVVVLQGSEVLVNVVGASHAGMLLDDRTVIKRGGDWGLFCTHSFGPVAFPTNCQQGGVRERCCQDEQLSTTRLGITELKRPPANIDQKAVGFLIRLL